MSHPLVLRLAAIALFAGAAAWALHQQTGYIVAAWACTNAPQGVWLSGAAAFALLAIGGGISWRALVRARSTSPARHFLASVALLAALVFAFALLLQIAAPFFLPGCVG